MKQFILIPPLIFSVLASLPGCSQKDQFPDRDLSDDQLTVTETELAGLSHERNFVFLTTVGDTSLTVPWLLETTPDSNVVFREARGWISRESIWEPFLAEQWETPPTRYPAQILPHGTLRIVVGDRGVVDGLIYIQEPRTLELALGTLLSQWAGPREERLQLLEASIYVGQERTNGVVLDMARLSSTEIQPLGDWAFLTSGDSLQVIVQGDMEHNVESPPNYRGWVRLGTEELHWPALMIDWTSTSAHQPARRDLPVSWTISSTNDPIDGNLEVSASEIITGTGVGPVLPVQALLEVAGEISIDGSSFPVHGLFNHRRR